MWQMRGMWECESVEISECVSVGMKNISVDLAKHIPSLFKHIIYGAEQCYC